MNYTTEQNDAIQTIAQNLQIIACAGSGKTQVISERIAHILHNGKENGIEPANIVAFTFTDKAAGELKERIYQLCKSKLGSDQGLGGMFVGTIHGYCLNILQEPPLYKYLKYSVLSDICQRLLIDRFSTKSGLTQTPLRDGRFLERWKDSGIYQSLLSIYSESDLDKTAVPDAVKEAIKSYYALLHEEKRLDYTTILTEALDSIKNNVSLRDKIKNQVKYLIVDEYQDVNPLQESIIKEIYDLCGNICVVGDDDQTIYQWRGSDVSNIITFNSRYQDVKQIAIGTNFRSSPAIVDAAKQFVEKIPYRLLKPITTFNNQSFERGDLLALRFDSVEDEANWVVGKIKEIYASPYKDKPSKEERGLSYSDMAILLRSVRHDAKPFIDALNKERIPFIVSGMEGLFETPEIRVLQQVFIYLANFTPYGSANPPVTLADLKSLFENSGMGLLDQNIAKCLSYLEKRKNEIPTSNEATLHLQRLYLDLLGELEISEDKINSSPNAQKPGEIIFFNLGKFSNVIADFEQINFKSNVKDLYSAFAGFLYHQAPAYYPEGGGDGGHVNPDAVQILTVHKAKGMQWPAVFVPCLRRNRFPAQRVGGRTVWHVIPDTCVKNVERYRGTEEDERRLFYVAMTRAEKYLFCSWAPIDRKGSRHVSQFFRDFTDNDNVLTSDTSSVPRKKPQPLRRSEEINIPLTFSELKYYFQCPYLFKLRFLYGFNTPIQQAMGYGNSLHNSLAEIHSESLKGQIFGPSDVDKMYDEHFYLPFISPANVQLIANLTKAFKKALGNYLTAHGDHLDKLVHVEKIIELNLSDGIVVNGRIDLIRKTDTNELVIVDFKSVEGAQEEDITKRQLHIYAVGYNQLTGENPDLIEIYNLDHGGVVREPVDDKVIMETIALIKDAGNGLRSKVLNKCNKTDGVCAHCDMKMICDN